MKGYKGFDKDFKCQGFQYEVGKTYEFNGDIKICERGFHFCDVPLAVWYFYHPRGSRFALVEATGHIAAGEGHKFCTDKITVVKEMTIDDLIREHEKLIASNTGDRSSTSNTGYCSSALNTGDYSSAKVTGKHSVAIVTGKDSKAKGVIGCWLVLAEWIKDEIKDVRVFKVDGEKIKADTFYILKGGTPVEVD